MPLPQLLSIVESLGEFRELLSELPSPSTRLELGGLNGSSDAVVIAALSEYAPRRFFVVVNDDVAGAERWLADLTTLVPSDAVAFYPPRESFGEAEAHAEVAGERVETLERIGRGGLRILITTSRALLERTQLPRALASARLELKKGDKIFYASSGGGGFGDPLERDASTVEGDLNLGYISRETAERDYGVVIGEVKSLGERSVYRVDADATAAERARRRRSHGGDGARVAR